ncbi:MAG TPA: polysaccharide biosynthesis tyrosine autokinase [Stellaceae bacterium]|nr:polysaccharide biosynthesis tyrosine autokinase [Stellaceae bacterium]
MSVPRLTLRPAALSRRERVSVLQPVASAPERQEFIETLRKLWRHRYFVLGCSVLALAASAVAALSIRPYYIAEAQVLIGVPEPRIFTTDQLLDPAGPDAEKVDNERVAMMSRDQAQKVIARLDLADNPVFAPRQGKSATWWHRLDPVGLFPAAWRARLHLGAAKQGPGGPRASDAVQTNRIIDALLSDVAVTRVGRSQVLSIDARAARPGLAARLANTWASVYLETERDDKLARTHRVETYLTNRITALRTQVAASDQAVENYRRKYSLYRGINANVTSEQLTQLNTQLILAQTAKAEADAKLRQALTLQHGGNGGSGGDPAVLGSPLIQLLKERQAAAQQRLAQLQTTYGDRYPKVIEAKAEVADIGRKLSVEVGHVIDGLRNAAHTADIRYANLEHNFQTLQTHMGVVGDKAIHLEALERDATVNRNLLEALLGRAGETIGRQELERPDAKLISPAAPPAAPGFPPRKLIVLLGTLAGSLVGLFGALMREGADRTFRRADDFVTATGLPVIASVPIVSGRVPPAAHVVRCPISPYSESLRKIYIGLLLSEAPQPPKTALVCSSVPAEGKSILAASLARMLAWNGKRVLLIDCDWRSPSLHQVFHCSNKAGLAALMTEENPGLHDLIFADPFSGVDVLAAGGWTPRMAHRMASERMRRVLETFANNYDLVILDGPPVLAGADALPLARMVDKTLFVVRWGHTKREAVHDAMRQLVDAQADLAGAVFARVDPKRYRQFTYANLNYEYARSTG